MIAERLHVSVNDRFLELALQYPLGNGLGGGGTSVPYFLQDLMRDRVVIENEYARILAEQGLPGLLLWLGFIAWIFTRRAPRSSDPWFIGKWPARLFCAISFATAPLGNGMLNAIPQTALVLLFAGWIAVPEVDERMNATVAAARQYAKSLLARPA